MIIILAIRCKQIGNHPLNSLKLTFDGSNHDEEVVEGGIIKNSQGVGIRGYSSKCGSVTSNEEKTFGLLWGVRLTNNMEIQNSIMEGDSLLVIKATRGENKMRWKATSITRDALCILNKINDIRIQHICREGNKVADSLIGYTHEVLNS